MYGDSHALSPDSTTIFTSNFQRREDVASVKREKQFLFMESAANTNYSSGLLRFRSAPTSLLANFTSGGEKGENLSSISEANSVHVMSESDDSNCKKSRFTAVNSQLPPQYPRQSGAQFGYGVGSPIGSDQQGRGRIGSSLARQNSSPAGLFSHFNSQNGNSGGRGIGCYRTGLDGGNGGLSSCSSRFKNHMGFSSGLPNSLGVLSKVENENTGPKALDEGKVGYSGGDTSFFSPELPFGTWNDSSYFAENFTIKRELGHDPKLFEKCEARNRPNILSHHLSLPKTSTEIEKLMHLQATVPCKVRAKRGCATHPRSIAERVRRTRISERMRKLQELVPNMDKQTNTADMLDLAFEYIKILQKEYKTVSDNRANCKCSAFQNKCTDQ